MRVRDGQIATFMSKPRARDTQHANPVLRHDSKVSLGGPRRGGGDRGRVLRSSVGHAAHDTGEQTQHLETTEAWTRTSGLRAGSTQTVEAASELVLFWGVGGGEGGQGALVLEPGLGQGWAGHLSGA